MKPKDENDGGRPDCLTSRHMQFIAIGAAIGSGLFLGSGAGIAQAGPSMLIAYALCGGAMYFIGRALGELTLADKREGSFIRYAEEYIGAWCGFVIGWGTWIGWGLVSMVDLAAAAAFLQFWWPGLPQWESMLVALGLIYAINRLGVRLFGEMEFWLALSKVLAILAVIAIGAAILAFGLNFGGEPSRLSTLWAHGGLFPGGLRGFAGILPLAFFAYGGVEVVGITAREADNPDHAVPKAINGVILRVTLFYVGSLGMVMTLIPWDRIDAHQSPFVLVFGKIGLPAAGVINFVVLTAVLSSCNSGIFVMGRTLSALALKGHAPRWLHRHDKRGIPARALSASAAAALIGVVVNYLRPSEAFGLLVFSAVVPLMWCWAGIAISHWRFCRRFPERRSATFGMPFFPYANMAVLVFIGGIVLLMATVSDMALPLGLGLGLLFGLIAIHRLIRGRVATCG